MKEEITIKKSYEENNLEKTNATNKECENNSESNCNSIFKNLESFFNNSDYVVINSFFNFLYAVSYACIYIIYIDKKKYLYYESCKTLLNWNRALCAHHYFFGFANLIYLIFYLITENKSYSKKNCLNYTRIISTNLVEIVVLIGMTFCYAGSDSKLGCDKLDKLTKYFLIYHWVNYGLLLNSILVIALFGKFIFKNEAKTTAVFENNTNNMKIEELKDNNALNDDKDTLNLNKIDKVEDFSDTNSKIPLRESSKFSNRLSIDNNIIDNPNNSTLTNPNKLNNNPNTPSSRNIEGYVINNYLSKEEDSAKTRK